MRTAEVARKFGLHPNTIRLYEKWGLLPPVPRMPNGYRVFGPEHLDQLQLIRLTLGCTWIGGKIRKMAHAVIHAGAAGDWERALACAEQHLKMIRAERRRAEKAARVLAEWAEEPRREGEAFLRISEVARLLDVSPDMLRNWERDQLVTVARSKKNGYRLYGRKEIDRLRVIRMLRRARYSTMSILRMLRQLDQGLDVDVLQVLDTPGDNEDILSASDHWLSALEEVEGRALEIVNWVRRRKDSHEKS